jgi:hypothetical protein
MSYDKWSNGQRSAPKKPYKGQSHTPKSRKGLGDYYGVAIPAKLGKIRSGLGMEVLSPKKMSKPPRSLA